MPGEQINNSYVYFSHETATLLPLSTSINPMKNVLLFCLLSICVLETRGQQDFYERELVSLGDFSKLPLYRVGEMDQLSSYDRTGGNDDGFSGKQVGGPAGPRVQLRVAGIVRRPLDLGVRASWGGVVVLTTAFNEVYGKRVGLYTDVRRVRARTPADLPRVESAARKIFGKALTFQEQPLGIETEGARNAIDVLTLTL